MNKNLPNHVLICDIKPANELTGIFYDGIEVRVMLAQDYGALSEWSEHPVVWSCDRPMDGSLVGVVAAGFLAAGFAIVRVNPRPTETWMNGLHLQGYYYGGK
jgi:hypothetical protein